DQRQPALWMVRNDRHMRRLAFAPADQSDVAWLCFRCGERIAEANAQARPQLIVPRIAAIQSRRVLSLESRLARSEHNESETIDRPRLAPAMSPASALQLPSGGDESLLLIHQFSSPQTVLPMNPPCPGNCAPGVWIWLASPIGIYGSPLKLIPLFQMPMQSCKYRLRQSGR